MVISATKIPQGFSTREALLRTTKPPFHTATFVTRDPSGFQRIFDAPVSRIADSRVPGVTEQWEWSQTPLDVAQERSLRTGRPLRLPTPISQKPTPIIEPKITEVKKKSAAEIIKQRDIDKAAGKPVKTITFLLRQEQIAREQRRLGGKVFNDMTPNEQKEFLKQIKLGVPTAQAARNVTVKEIVKAKEDDANTIEIGVRTDNPEKILDTPEIRQLKKDNPQLFKVLKDEGIINFNKAIRAEQFVAEQDLKRFKRTHTEINEQWIENTELAKFKKENPEGFNILNTQGWDAFNRQSDKQRQDTIVQKAAIDVLAPFSIRKLVDGKIENQINTISWLREHPRGQQILKNAGFEDKNINEWTALVNKPHIRQTAQERYLKEYVRVGGRFDEKTNIDKLVKDNPQLLFLQARDKPITGKRLEPEFPISQWIANFVATRENEPIWNNVKQKDAILRDLAISEYSRLFGKKRVLASQTLDFLKGFVPDQTIRAIKSKHWDNLSTPNKVAMVSGDAGLTILYAVGLFQIAQALKLRPPKVILPPGAGGVPAKALSPKTTLKQLRDIPAWQLNMSIVEKERFLTLKKANRKLTTESFRLVEDFALTPKQAIKATKTGLIPQASKLWKPKTQVIQESPKVKGKLQVQVAEASGLSPIEYKEFLQARLLDSKITPAQYKLSKTVFNQMKGKQFDKARAFEAQYRTEVLKVVKTKKAAAIRKSLQEAAEVGIWEALSPEQQTFFLKQQEDLKVIYRQVRRDLRKQASQNEKDAEEARKASIEKEKEVALLDEEDLTNDQLLARVTAKIKAQVDEKAISKGQEIAYERRLIEIQASRKRKLQEAATPQARTQVEAATQIELLTLSRTITKTETRVLPFPITKVIPLTEVKTATQLATELETQTKTQLQTKTKLQLKTELQTALQTQTKLQTATSPVTQTVIKVAFVPTSTIPTGKAPPLTITPIKPSTKVPIKPPPKKPPEEIKPTLPKEKEERRKKRKKQFPITWRQSKIAGYILIKPPYRQQDISRHKTAPPGAKIVRGIGSAFKTIQALGGDANVLLNIDAGAYDITIISPSRKPGKPGAIRFKKDTKKTKSALTLSGVRFQG